MCIHVFRLLHLEMLLKVCVGSNVIVTYAGAQVMAKKCHNNSINYNTTSGSPFHLFFIRDILYPFTNCLMVVKSQCELIPFVQAISMNFGIFVIKQTRI